MQYAILKIGSGQFKVSPGDEIEVNKIKGEKGAGVTFNNVMLLATEDDVILGHPLLDNVSVQAKILEQKKGKKIDVYRFKAKARQRKKIGFRPHITHLKIEKIEVKSGKTEKKTKN